MLLAPCGTGSAAKYATCRTSRLCRDLQRRACRPGPWEPAVLTQRRQCQTEGATLLRPGCSCQCDRNAHGKYRRGRAAQSRHPDLWPALYMDTLLCLFRCLRQSLSQLYHKEFPVESVCTLGPKPANEPIFNVTLLGRQLKRKLNGTGASTRRGLPSQNS